MDLWSESWRPTTIDEMALPDDQRKIFAKYIVEGSIPHLLLYGPPGSGKTTLAKIFINRLPCTAMILNASSSDRGVETVKTKINMFASSALMPGKNLKIIFLDEADGMSNDAFDALKNTMERHSATCRFILTANNINGINPAIQSRCTQFQFSTYPIDAVFNLCCEILEAEEIKFKELDLDMIVDRLYPDIRSIINNIQKCSSSGTLTVEGIMAFNISEDEISDFIITGNLRGLREAWGGVGSFTWLYPFLINKFIDRVKQSIQPDMAIKIAEYLYRDSTIADKEINATACVLEIMLLLEVKGRF